MAVTLAEFRTQFQATERERLIEVIDDESMILPLLSFITTDDLKYEFVQRTGLPSIAFRELNTDYAPSAGVYGRLSEDLKMFGGEIRTDAQLVNKRGGRARLREVEGQVKAAGLFFDHEFIHGDSAVDPKSFDGLKVRLAGGTQELFPVAPDGEFISVPLVDEVLDLVRGANGRKHLIMNKANRRHFSAQVVGSAGGSTVRDQGQQLETYQGARIVTLEENHLGQEVLPFNESRGASTDCSSVYCVRFGGGADEEDVQGLLGSSFMQREYQGKRGVFHIDLLDNNVGVGVFHGKTLARLAGLKRPPRAA